MFSESFQFGRHMPISAAVLSLQICTNSSVWLKYEFVESGPFHYNKLSFLSLPEVPSLVDVPCLSAQLDDCLLTILKNQIFRHGTVASRPPVQLEEFVEKPGGILVRWCKVGKIPSAKIIQSSICWKVLKKPLWFWILYCLWRNNQLQCVVRNFRRDFYGGGLI